MRKILLCFIAMAAMTSFFSCQQKSDGLCHIEGVVNGEQYEGKRIFVVPMFGPKTALTGNSPSPKTLPKTLCRCIRSC